MFLQGPNESFGSFHIAVRCNIQQFSIFELALYLERHGSYLALRSENPVTAITV